MCLGVTFNGIFLEFKQPWVIGLVIIRESIEWKQTDGKIFEKPPPEKMICSHAPSGSSTVDPGLTWVAPTAVTNGHEAWSRGLCHETSKRKSAPTGNSGLNTVPLGSSRSSYKNVKIEVLQEASRTYDYYPGRYYCCPQRHYLHCCKSQMSPSFRAVKSENGSKTEHENISP